MTTSVGRFLTARWHDLVMLNYEVDPDVLRPFVPRGVELDTYEDRHYVSMVGFRFLDTRVLGVPVPWHRNFDEINLRFYVRREAPDGLRRGVVFVREIVPRWWIAAIARWVYNERYVAVPMRHHDARVDNAGQLTYEFQMGGRWHGLSATVAGTPFLPTSNSEAEFITEHYWGYARQRDGSTVEYQVEHPQWTVQSANECRFDCDVATVYGSQFAPFLTQPAHSAFLATGSEIAVRKGVRLR